MDNISQELNYSFDWFKYHAEQRIKMFNYFIILNGFIFNAVAVMKREELVFELKFLSSIGILISLCFILLDIRNDHLVEIGEEKLIEIEKSLFTEGRGILLCKDCPKKERNCNNCSQRSPGKKPFFLKHSVLLRIIISLFIIAYIVFIILF